MDRFEFAAGLFSLIVGLGLADMGISFHRLIKRRDAVRWNPLALATAAYAVLLLVTMWYDLWGLRAFPFTTNFWFYLGLLAELFVLFLFAAGTLPDDSIEGLDLYAYYDRQQRYLWTLLLIFQTAFTAHWVYFMLLLKLDILPRLHEVAVPLAGIGLLFLVRRRWLQIAVLVVLFVFKAIDYGGTSL